MEERKMNVKDVLYKHRCINVDDDTWQKISENAKKNYMSISAYIRFILDEHLAKEAE